MAAPGTRFAACVRERNRREEPREQPANQDVLADYDLRDFRLETGDDGYRLRVSLT